MYKQKRFLFLFPFLLAFMLPVGAQIAVTPSAGCLPLGLLNANFVYSGSGTPSNIMWSFGDGSPSSNVNPSQHSYLSAGNFVVSFSAVVNGQPVSYSTTAAVHQQPNGNFTFQQPPSRCAPMNVTFSGTGSAPGMIFNWDFGDNTLGNGANPGHSYSSAGSYTPILTVQDPSTGCFKNISNLPIHVSTPPTINLLVSPGNNTCASIYNPSFSGGTSVSGSPLPGGTLSYNWNFGNGQTSGVANPGVIAYSGVGYYPVVLTVTDNNQCSAQTTVVIGLISPTLSVTFPPIVCVAGQYTTTAAQVFSATVQSSEPSTVWNMGDGTILTFPPPPIVLPNGSTSHFGALHTYAAPGVYPITVTASSGQCSTVLNTSITVEKIVPEFTLTPQHFTCMPALPSLYVNQSTVNSSSTLNYTWAVQQWPTLVQQIQGTNLNFTYLQNSPNPYTIYNTYAPNVKLSVLSTAGCTAEIGHVFDTISRPKAFFNVDKSEGCVPLTVTYRDTSFYFRGIVVPTWTNSITSYTWYSGAGPTAILTGTLGLPPSSNSNIPNFVYTYTATGVYTPSLHIENTMGCSSISFPGTITVVNPPTISYTLPPSPICAGQPVQFTLSAGSSGPVQHWNVNTDGGYFSGCVSDPMPSSIFTHLGSHSFTISAYKNSCKSDTVGTQVLTVVGPIIRGWYKVHCFTKDVDFFYGVEDATSATIDFGEGSPPTALTVTLTGSIPHTYASTGDYTVTLRAYNSGNGCPVYTQTLLVHVRLIKADFTITPVICKNLKVAVNGAASIDVLKGSRAYVWRFDNTAPEHTEKTTTLSLNTFSLVGVHTVTLMVKDYNGCMDMKTGTFRVSEPVPGFTFNANPICVSNYPVQILLTTSQTPDSVKNYRWNFGDGTPFGIPSSTLITTTQTGPTFTYNLGSLQSQTFVVSLVAINVVGCSNSINHTLTVNDPKLDFSATSPGMCLPGGVMNFNINAALTHSLYQMNWGDQTSAASLTWAANATFTTSHPYSATGIYTPTVTLTDNGGCTKTTVLSPLHVQTAVVPSFTFFNIKSPLTTGNGYCMPVTLSVTSTSDSLQFPLQYNWHSGKPNVNWTVGSSFVSGSTYTATGIYQYSLMLLTVPAGCTSTVSKEVQIYDPHIDFVILPDDQRSTYCLGEPITFSVTNTKGVQFWDWDFGDGNLRGPFTNPAFQSVLVYENTYFPTSTNGMLTFQVVGKTNALQCKDFKRRTLQIIRVRSGFNRNNEKDSSDYEHCFGKTELFTNLSSTNGGALTYTWNFGNGATATSTDAIYSYPSPGFYIVKLYAREGTNSCMGDTGKPMTIFPLPSASISILDTLLCPGDTFKITMSGKPGVSGMLSGYLQPGHPAALSLAPGNSLSINTSLALSTKYTFAVKDENSCESPPVEAYVKIVTPAPSVHTATTVIIGQIVQLNADAGPGFTYTWTPEIANLSATNIPHPVSNSTVDITYSVTIVDEPLHCFITVNTYSIFVLPLTTVDVPTAFTPNGDGTNDLIYADGWGIRKLIFFKIFDRWGQLLFESNDLKQGWDGTYEGIPQNMETYVYQVEVETYVDTNPKIFKSGTFKLIR